MIILLGTSHVSKQSSREVEQAIATADLVAIELDINRAHGLLQKREATFAEMRQALGLKAAAMAAVMRSLQKRIAKSVGVLPGVEMRAALKEVQKQQKTVVFIDRDIKVTMQRLSKAFGWREVTQIFRDFFRRRQVPIHPSDELVLELLEDMKVHYPRIYKVMVSERDLYMTKVLLHVAKQNPEKRIVAIVGKGHVPGLINYLKAHADVMLWSSPSKN